MAPRILVVEDDRPTLNMLLTLLRGWGYEADGAADGRAALARIAEQCPRVIISDLVMPGMSGIELLQAIRAMKACPAVFFLLTGQCSAPQAVSAICEGADECLLKPFNPDVLHALLVQRGVVGASA